MTYTAEQIEAIGGRRWSKSDGTLRVYINTEVWAPMVGLEIDYYKSGNIQHAALNGEKISNSKAYKLTAIKVYWQDGKIWITKDAELADQIRDAIDRAVEALDSNDDDTDDQGQDVIDTLAASTTVAKLRETGRTVRQIAAAIGVSISTVYRWARDICRPRPTNAAALAALAI